MVSARLNILVTIFIIFRRFRPKRAVQGWAGGWEFGLTRGRKERPEQILTSLGRISGPWDRGSSLEYRFWQSGIGYDTFQKVDFLPPMMT